MKPPHIQQNTCRNCKEKPECTCDKTETNFMQKGDTYLCGHCRPQEFEKASPCDCICHSTQPQQNSLGCPHGRPAGQICPHCSGINSIPTQHTCCDGECNHDDCCGKVPENCPLMKGTTQCNDCFDGDHCDGKIRRCECEKCEAHEINTRSAPIPPNAQRTGDTGRISTQPEWMKEFWSLTYPSKEVEAFIKSTIQKEIERERSQLLQEIEEIINDVDSQYEHEVHGLTGVQGFDTALNHVRQALTTLSKRI